eukprot:2547905-Pyramimonas_sp.AAC.1
MLHAPPHQISGRLPILGVRQRGRAGVALRGGLARPAYSRSLSKLQHGRCRLGAPSRPALGFQLTRDLPPHGLPNYTAWPYQG